MSHACVTGLAPVERDGRGGGDLCLNCLLRKLRGVLARRGTLADERVADGVVRAGQERCRRGRQRHHLQVVPVQNARHGRQARRVRECATAAAGAGACGRRKRSYDKGGRKRRGKEVLREALRPNQLPRGGQKNAAAQAQRPKLFYVAMKLQLRYLRWSKTTLPYGREQKRGAHM